MPKIEVNHLLRVLCGCSNGKRNAAGGGWPSSPCSMPGGTSFAVGTELLDY
jgi:hypothetical protein